MDSLMLLTLSPYQNLLVSTFFIVGLLAIFLLIRMIKMMVDHQIDDQMAKMIPLKSVRDKIRVNVRWR
jgi:hypothetical protein|tara:strand:+ start:345 stop:548 length:204 start_codon:yes stop_codon:yes gene_type:complete